MRRIHGKLMLVLFASLVFGLGGTLAAWLAWRPNQWLANRLMVQMQHAETDQIDWYAAQLAALDAPGWEALLATVQNSERPELRLAARQALFNSVRSWRMLSADVSERKVASIAHLLAGRVSSADASALCFYADLAERLLDWPSSSGDATGRVYDCEQVVRAARKVGWPLQPTFEPSSEPASTANSSLEITHFSDLSESDAAISSDTQERVSAKISDLPEPEMPAEGESSPEQFAADEVSSAPLILESPKPPAAKVQTPTEVSTNPPAPPQRDWQSTKLVELVHALREPQSAAAAEAELRRRNFNAANLRVAHAVADPNADNRLKLVHAIPELVGVDAIGWLMLLAKDESPRIRFAAVQLLSTTNDPQVLRRLQELDETETDDQIRLVIRKAQMIVR